MRIILIQFRILLDRQRERKRFSSAVRAKIQRCKKK
jgi:hypothetical protein